MRRRGKVEDAGDVVDAGDGLAIELVEVFVEHPKFETPFIEAVSTLDEVLECHHITGEFSLLLKVKVTDMAAFRRLLIEKLNTIRGVRQTRTVMVLATWKEQHRIKVD